MLDLEQIPENTETPGSGSHDMLEVFFFFFFCGYGFFLSEGIWYHRAFFHTLISEFLLKKVFCEASQNCFGISPAITSLSGACEALVIEEVKEVLPEINSIARDKNFFCLGIGCHGVVMLGGFDL